MGFADVYDRYRPEPPEPLASILAQFASVTLPRLVVDLGCGTGISTRYWADKAVEVIGVDPSADMLREAEVQKSAPNIRYQVGFGHSTGLPGGQADIVTCSQSFHWMDPEPTLAEVARLLRPGGVFAAYDHVDSPVTSNWQADAAYRKFHQEGRVLEKAHQITARVPRWPKDQHLARIQESGHFRYTCQFCLHQTVQGNAERLVGLATSYGFVQSLFKLGLTESDLGLDTFRAEIERLLGAELRPWLWSTRVCVGVI